MLFDMPLEKLETYSYFDGVNFAARCDAHALY